MIPRYTRKVMREIWSDEERFKIWLDIEVAVLEGWAKKGVVPTDVPGRIKEKALISLEKVSEWEKRTGHEVVAFINALGESLGEDEKKYLHLGITSSDVMDTCFSIQLKRACGILEEDIKEVLESLRKLALMYKETPCVGRTHGIHAEPTTFGFKILSHFAEFKRNLIRLKMAEEEVSYGKISGAVGNYSTVPPDVEEYALLKLGLKPEPVATQVIPRDRYAFLFSILAVIAGSIERLATNIRLWQKTEVSEAFEPFGREQKGSSVMPHKRNPILAENLCGLVRIVRSCILPALENIALWEERDISHSSAERVIAPSATITLDFALARLKRILGGLEVKADKMTENLKLTHGLIYSSRYLTSLVESGVPREEAYELIQKASSEVAQGKYESLEEALKGMKVEAKLDLDPIFRRAFENTVKVVVMKRSDVLDPEGRAVMSALKKLGFEEVGDVRAGKVFFMKMHSDGREDEKARKMAEKLLANPVVDEFDVEW